MLYDFYGITLEIIETNDDRKWYMTIKDAAKGCGISRTAAMNHLERHGHEFRDEIEKGVTLSDTLGGRQKTTILYRAGVNKLGLLVETPQGAALRQWATNLMGEAMDTTDVAILSRQLGEFREEYRQNNIEMRAIVHGLRTELDDIRELVGTFCPYNKVETAQRLLIEVKAFKNQDGRTIMGHVRKTLGISRPYEYANIDRVINVLRNMLGQGVFGIVPEVGKGKA